MLIAFTKYLKSNEEVDRYREAHRKYTKQAVAEGKILVSGRRSTMDGAIIISKEISKDQFQNFLNNDPFIKASVASYEIFEFVPSFYDDKMKSFLGDEKIIDSLPLPKDDDLSQETRDFLKKLPPINVFRMFSHLPQSLPPFIQLAQSFLDHGKFTARTREIAILRVAYLTRAPYEWHQHVFLGQAAGLENQEIEIIRNENPVRSLNQEENFVCQVADELTLSNHLNDETFKKLFSIYTSTQGCELILTISFYNMLSRFLNGTRTPIESTNPLAGLSSPTAER